MNNPIPDGYRQDAQGRLIPESLIKPIDLARDQLVNELVDKAKVLRNALREFKEGAFADIGAFRELSAEQYGVKVGGKKGNVSLITFDGKYKVSIRCQETLAFDERLQAAKELIDECLREWTADARPELLALINDAFRVDTQGEIRTARVLALRRYEITDERWQRAMQALGDATQAVGSKSYILLHERVGDTNQYEAISLDIAGV